MTRLYFERSKVEIDKPTLKKNPQKKSKKFVKTLFTNSHTHTQKKSAMSLRPGVEHSIKLWKELPQNAEKLKSCFDLYEEVFSRICDRKKAKHLVAVENKFVAMFNGNTDVKSIGTKDLRQMIELKHTKCKARPLRKDFDEKNPDDKVRSVTEKAFREVKSGQWETAIATLSDDLYCVGPATGDTYL